MSEKKASAAEVRIISETFVESVVYLSKKTVLPEPSFVSVPDQLKRLAAAEAEEDRSPMSHISCASFMTLQ